jgi:serine/threonine protein kinase
MGIAEQLVGHELPGRRANVRWTVLERISNGHEEPSGAIYSVGYRVKSNEGHEAFMKVTDLDLLTDETCSIFERTSVAVQAHKFEREILEHCRGNNMDRIVVAIDYGDTIVQHEKGREPIFYLVFELAECDVRVQVDRRTRFDLAWVLAALHDLAVAIQQLHSGEVSHNDIKPANFLVFTGPTLPDRMQKLADLGCATSPLIFSIYDEAICIGDRRYAPPEILYAKEQQKELCNFEARRAIDLYHLGSMILFLITGRMLTPEVVRRLNPECRPPNEDSDWSFTFDEVLPYWREALSRAIVEFREQLPVDRTGKLTVISEGIIESLVQLGEPDPKLRGHPLNRAGQADRLSVRQYISLFDRLRRLALH